MRNKILSWMLILVCGFSLLLFPANAVNSYTVNGKTIRYSDVSSSPGECWAYANAIYNKIWGTSFSAEFSTSDNSLRNLSDSELALTADNLKKYVSNAPLGASLRICNAVNLHSHDGYISGQPGHNQIIVQKDSNGFTVFQGGLSASPYCNEHYYTWSEYISTSWLGGQYKYIKYIKWPGATAYSNITYESYFKLDPCGGSVAPTSVGINFGDYWNLPTPTRSGYVFRGWYTEKDGNGYARTNDDKYWGHNENGTLYAYWKWGTSTFALDAAGGTCDQTSITIKFGDYYNLPTPTREGYVFDGWYGKPNGEGEKLTSDKRYWGLDENGTIYANWISVTPGTPAFINLQQQYSSDETVTFTWGATENTTHYNFWLWQKDDSGSWEDEHGTWSTYSHVFKVESGLQYDLPPGEYRVIVQSYNSNYRKADGSDWLYQESDFYYFTVKDNNVVYTMTYDANGGAGAPPANTVTSGESFTLSSIKPIRTGYTFQGWAESATATEATYQPESNYTIIADTTLYAVWKANTYSVTYDANGGSGAPAAQEKIFGQTLILSSTVPNRTGYTFQGWGNAPTSSSPVYQPGGNYTKNSKLSLYAIWKANTYTVSYDANGGTGAPDPQTKTHGMSLTLSSTKPTRTDFTFLGWADSPAATTAAYLPLRSYTADADVTLYAVWQATIKTYQITYNANGGSGAPDAQTKTQGQALTLSSTVPTRDGYTFLGWAVSPTATKPAYQPGASYTKDEATVMYAIWEQIITPPDNFISYDLKAEAAGKNRVKLTWGAVDGAEGYIIYRRIGSGSFSYRYMVPGTTYTDVTASETEWNFYRVYPFFTDAGGKRILGNSANYTYAKGVLPMVPGLKAIGRTGYTTVSWNSVPEAEGYIIYRRIGSSGSFSYRYMTKSNVLYFNDVTASKTEWNFYRVYPYYMKDGTRILNQNSDYTYAKAS